MELTCPILYVSISISIMFPSLISNGVQVTSTHVLSGSPSVSLYQLRLHQLFNRGPWDYFCCCFYCFLGFTHLSRTQDTFRLLQSTQTYTHIHRVPQIHKHTHTHTIKHMSHNPAGDAEKDWWDWHSVYPSGVLKYVGWIDAKRIPVFNTHWKYTGCQKCIWTLKSHFMFECHRIG